MPLFLLRFWKPILIAVVLIAVVGHAFRLGGQLADTRNALGNAQEQIKLDAQAAKLTAKVLDQAKEAALARAKQADDLKGKVAAYEQELADQAKADEELQQHHDETIQDYEDRLKKLGKAKPHARDCILSDDDVRRLRAIK